MDCSNLTLSIIDFKIKDHNGHIVHLHKTHVRFSIICLNGCGRIEHLSVSCFKYFRMSDSDNTQPSQEVPQEKQEAPQTIAKPKRKPRESTKSKVIVVSVNPIEFFDDQRHHQRMNRSQLHLDLDLKAKAKSTYRSRTCSRASSRVSSRASSRVSGRACRACSRACSRASSRPC